MTTISPKKEEKSPMSNGATPKESSSKLSSNQTEYQVSIGHLNEENSSMTFKIHKETMAKELFNDYCDYLIKLHGQSADVNFERDYFGLKYSDASKHLHWLELNKTVYSQMPSPQKATPKNKGTPLNPINFRITFRMKHYPASASDIHCPLTQFLFYLQIRRDLIQGRLLCPTNDDLIIVGSHIYQAEEHDLPLSINEDKIRNHFSELDSELLEKKIFLSLPPNSLKEILIKYMSLRGMSSKDAVKKVLDTVTFFPTYGIDPYKVEPLSLPKVRKEVEHTTSQLNINAASDNEMSLSDRIKRSQTLPSNGVSPKSLVAEASSKPNYYLGVGHLGMQLFVGTSLDTTYHWANIERITYKDRILKIRYTHKEGIKNKTNKFSFRLADSSTALSIWRWANDRKCFITLPSEEKAKKIKSSNSFLARSRSFKFSGKSLAELKNQTPKELSTLLPEINYMSMRIVGDSPSKRDIHLAMKSFRSPSHLSRPTLPELDSNPSPASEDAATEISLRASLHSVHSNEPESPVERAEANRLDRQPSGDAYDVKQAIRDLDSAVGMNDSLSSKKSKKEFEEHSTSYARMIAGIFGILAIALTVYVMEARGPAHGQENSIQVLARQLRQSSLIDAFGRSVYDPIRDTFFSRFSFFKGKQD